MREIVALLSSGVCRITNSERICFRDVCLRFSDLETKLGEIDRARAIYAHASQICDPRVRIHPSLYRYLEFRYFWCFVQVTQKFWQTWKEFEIKHGNEDTVREMLRIKRSVQATFNTQVNFMSTQMLVAQNSVEAAEAAQGGGATTRTPQSLPSITFYLLCVFSGDEMAKLEAKARQLAEESAQDQPQGDKGILFVR